jgi:mitochondrial FAD-linked sulfhydryl oxidase
MAGESAPSHATAAEADCDKPACAVKGDMFAMMKDAARAKGKTRRDEGESADASTSAKKACPVDREELGLGTWALLHTMAAHYPDKPDALYRVQARRFFDALGLLYPCGPCASDFQQDMAKTPPEVQSRASLAVWLCNRHNEVNEKLGKPTFPCVLKDLDERWRKGGKHCWHG